MIVNERRNARNLSNIDPPQKIRTKKDTSPPNYTVLKGQSQLAKGYTYDCSGTYGGMMKGNVAAENVFTQLTASR
jgi:hypothetical protein